MSLLNDVKTAWTAAFAMMGTAATSVMQWLPATVTVVSGILGITLSIVLIRSHWANGSKARLELQLLKEKDAKQKREASKRMDTGAPLRRATDESQE